MNFYDRWVLPPILDLVMQQAQFEATGSLAGNVSFRASSSNSLRCAAAAEEGLC